jgi:hypothetical protein
MYINAFYLTCVNTIHVKEVGTAIFEKRKRKKLILVYFQNLWCS